MDWLDHQETLKSLLQHDNLKASILRRSAFFIGQLSHPYMTTAKAIALTRQTFVGKVMALLFNTLSRFVLAFLPRSFMAEVHNDFGSKKIKPVVVSSSCVCCYTALTDKSSFCSLNCKHSEGSNNQYLTILLHHVPRAGASLMSVE